MKPIEALCILLLMPRNSEQYKMALQEFQGKQLVEPVKNLIGILFNQSGFEDNPLSAYVIRNMESINEVENPSDRLKIVINELQQLTILPECVLSHLAKKLEENPHLTQKNMLIMKIMLRHYFGKSGDQLISDKLIAGEKIKLYLAAESTELENLPPHLITILKFMKSLIHHEDRNIRMRARDFCESAGIPLNLRMMLALSVDGLAVLDSKESNDVALVVGPTGSGKSTFINGVLGFKLKRTKSAAYGTRCLSVTEDPEKFAIATIGNGASQTVYARAFQLKGLPSLVDTAGFKDTRQGSDLAMAAPLSFPLAVQKAKTIRAIFIVVEFNIFEITSGMRGQGLRELCRTLSNVIDLQILRHQSLPIRFVISKLPNITRGEPPFDPQKMSRVVKARAEKILKDNANKYRNLRKLKETLAGLQKDFNSLQKILNILKAFDFKSVAESLPKLSTLQMLLHNQAILRLGAISQFLEKAKLSWAAEGINEGRCNVLAHTIQELLDKPNQEDARRSKIHELQREENLLKQQVLQQQKEYEEIAAEYEILNLIKVDPQIFIFRGYNEPAMGDKPDDIDNGAIRNYLNELVKKQMSIPKDLFKFNSHDPAFQSIKNWLEQAASNILRKHEPLMRLVNKHKQLENECKEVERDEVQLVDKLNTNVILAADGLLQRVQEAKNNCQAEIKNLNAQLPILKIKEADLLAKIKELESAPAVDFYHVMQHEERWRIGALLGKQSEFKFSFPCDHQIERVEVSAVLDEKSDKLVFATPHMPMPGQVDQSAFCNKTKQGDSTVSLELISNQPVTLVVSKNYKTTGTFVINKCNLEGGDCELTYTSNPGENGLAGVRFFVLPKHIPIYQNQLNELKVELERLQSNIAAVEKNLQAQNNFTDTEWILANIPDKKVIEEIQALLKQLGISEDEFNNKFSKVNGFELVRAILNWKEINFGASVNVRNKMERLKEKLILQTMIERLKPAGIAVEQHFKSVLEIISLFQFNGNELIEKLQAFKAACQENVSKGVIPPEIIAIAEQRIRELTDNQQSVLTQNPLPGFKVLQRNVLLSAPSQSHDQATSDVKSDKPIITSRLSA